MNCFVRTVAIIWTVLFALPETSACAAGWRLSQAAAQAAQDTPHQDAQHQDTQVPAATATEQQAQPAQQTPPVSARKDASHENTEDGTPATVIDDRDAEGILGKNVYSAANEDMGRVVDVIVKRTGEVRAAVIDFGGFLGVGSRTIAIDWSALRFPTSGPMDHIILELNHDQVRLAPDTDQANLWWCSASATYNPTRKLQLLSTNFARRPTRAGRSTIGPGEG